MGGRREFCTLTADMVSDLVSIVVLCVSTHRRQTDKGSNKCRAEREIDVRD